MTSVYRSTDMDIIILNVSENLIFNLINGGHKNTITQWRSQPYNNNENIHVDNNKIRTLEIVRENGISIKIL